MRITPRVCLRAEAGGFLLLQRGGVELVFGKSGVGCHFPGGILEPHALLPQGQHLGNAILQRYGGAGFGRRTLYDQYVFLPLIHISEPTRRS